MGEIYDCERCGRTGLVGAHTCNATKGWLVKENRRLKERANKAEENAREQTVGKRIKTLEAERDLLRGIVSDVRGVMDMTVVFDYPVVYKKIEAILNRTEPTKSKREVELEEALSNWDAHLTGCYEHSETMCDCGLNKARQLLEVKS